ncbi:MAG: hypothetical protein GF310_06100 [candidate division Zixibacteria bacterium]|nr:hypothetical protein [candidate division Zixibacteria bacterium]
MKVSLHIQNGLERIDTARRGIADTIPVWAHTDTQPFSLAKVPVRKFLTDPRLFIRTHLLLAEYYGLDTSNMTFDLFNIEAEAMGLPLNWTEDRLPEPAATTVLIREPAELNKLHPPDPYKDGRMPFVLEVNRLCSEMGIDNALRFCGPFSLASRLRGLTQLIMDTMDNPEFVHRLMKFVTEEVLAPYILAIKDAFPGGYPVGVDAFASLPICSLDIIKEFSIPYIIKLREMVGEVGCRALWGDRLLPNPNDMFEMKKIYDPKTLWVADPDVFEVGPKRIKEFAIQNNMFLILGIGEMNFSEEKRDELMRQIQEYVTVGGNGGKCAIYFQGVPSRCSSELIRFATQVAHYYGQKESVYGKGSFQYVPQKPFEEWVAEKGENYTE